MGWVFRGRVGEARAGVGGALQTEADPCQKASGDCSSSQLQIVESVCPISHAGMKIVMLVSAEFSCARLTVFRRDSGARRGGRSCELQSRTMAGADVRAKPSTGRSSFVIVFAISWILVTALEGCVEDQVRRFWLPLIFPY